MKAIPVEVERFNPTVIVRGPLGVEKTLERYIEISKIFEGLGYTHFIDSEGNFLENKAYAFEKDQPIQNLAATGAVVEASFFSNTIVAEGTYTSVAPESVSGDGINFAADVTSGDELTFTITNPGSGFSMSDNIVFSYASLSADSSYDKVTLAVSNTDHFGVDYFPTGLADADVVDNALPLINVFISTNSE